MAKRLTAAEQRYLEGARDQSLVRLRRAYREEIVAQISRLTADQTKLANQLDRRIASVLVYRKNGTLTPSSRREVDRAVEQMVDEALGKFAARLDLAVHNGTRASADATAKFLERKGLSVNRAAARDIASKVAWADKKFYGATTRQRVKRIGKSQVVRVDAVLDTARGEERDRERILERAATPVGGPRTPGGSMLKEMTRVFVVDAVRKANEADTGVMIAAGVGFAYRRLSDVHEFRGGSEVCEQLNIDVYSGIRGQLRAAGIDPSEVDLRGLYPLTDLPEFPHAGCACTWEPLIP